MKKEDFKITPIGKFFLLEEIRRMPATKLFFITLKKSYNDLVPIDIFESIEQCNLEIEKGIALWRHLNLPEYEAKN